MAHVFRKKKSTRSGSGSTKCESPEEPPSPDLSQLTPEEIDILHRVIQRQEEFENEEASCILTIHHQLEQYEEAVRAQGSGKGRLKHIDLRLCRLCFKTKFADGIGRLCHYCRKRVCQRCGEFTKGRWDHKKKKVVRSKWRCNMCDMKRKFFCKTGVWYHGQRARPTLNNALFSQKTRSLDADITEDESRWHALSPASSDAVVTDTDLPRAHVSSFQAIMQTRGRRKSMPIFRTECLDISDNESDEDPYNHSIRRRRSRRHSRRHSRRSRQTSPAQTVRMPPRNHVGNDDYEESCPNAGEIGFISRDIPNQRELFFYMSGDSDNDSIPETSDYLLSNRKPDGQSHDSSEHLVNVLSPDHMGSISYSGPPESQFKYPSNKSPEKIVIDSVCRDIERRFSSEVVYQHNTPRTERRRKNPSVDPNYLTPENPERNRSYSSDSNSSMRSFVSSITDYDNAEIHQIPFTQDYFTSLEPREILLYRDVMDQSTRSSGLGMRVMFGKKGYGGKLGAFVSKVDRNGPADSYGIRKGDQILLWNGKSLMGTTLEESMEVIGQSSDVVQLLVVHHTTSDNEESSTNGCEKFAPHSATTREMDDRSNCATPPTSLNLTRKRRMLPKTPVEIKKEDRRVSGCVRMAVTHEDLCLLVTLDKAESLVSVDHHTPLNPVAMVHLLPNRGGFPMHQTRLQFNMADPTFDETFTFHDIQREELSRLSLEVTLWTVVEDQHLFLGEVLLDFCDIQLDNQFRTYSLQDHDENSSPLPVRKRKQSSDVTTTSPMTSINDGSSWSTSPGVQYSPWKDPLQSEDRGAYHMTSGYANGRDRRFKLNVTQSVPNSPQLSPISAAEDSVYLGGDHRESIPSLVRKRMSSAKSKVAVLAVESRRHSMYDRRKLTVRSSSLSEDTAETAWSGRNYDNPSPISRRSAVSCMSGTEELSKPPQPLNAGDGTNHFPEDDDDNSSEYQASGVCGTFGRLDPDGNDVASLLGPGQMPPKPSSETAICGSIRLAFMVSKGQLEVDIINVTDLNRSPHSTPPDTYVKAYLVGGSKVIQKKKTHTVKASFSPFFRRTIKYSACNIHGRAIKVILWARHGAFDRKQSLGEVVIKLDGLDLMHQSSNWYKLFPSGATDFGSNESLHLW